MSPSVRTPSGSSSRSTPTATPTGNPVTTGSARARPSPGARTDRHSPPGRSLPGLPRCPRATFLRRGGTPVSALLLDGVESLLEVPLEHRVVLTHREMPDLLHLHEHGTVDAFGGTPAVSRGRQIVVLTGEHDQRAVRRVDLPKSVTKIVIHRVEVQVTPEGLRALCVVEPRRSTIAVRRLWCHEIPHATGRDLRGVGVRMLPPVQEEPGGVIGALDRDDSTETIRMVQCQLQCLVAAEGTAGEDRILQFERITEAGDEGRVPLRAEQVLLLPPLSVGRWVGLSVAGQVVGDHAIMVGDVGVFEQVTPLVVVATGCVLADDGLPFPVLQVEDPALVAQYIDGHVASGHR